MASLRTPPGEYTSGMLVAPQANPLLRGNYRNFFFSLLAPFFPALCKISRFGALSVSRPLQFENLTCPGHKAGEYIPLAKTWNCDFYF